MSKKPLDYILKIDVYAKGDLTAKTNFILGTIEAINESDEISAKDKQEQIKSALAILDESQRQELEQCLT